MIGISTDYDFGQSFLTVGCEIYRKGINALCSGEANWNMGIINCFLGNPNQGKSMMSRGYVC